MRYLHFVVLATVLVCGGCSDDQSDSIDSGTTDTDTDTDTDIDIDTDADADTDTDTGPDPYGEHVLEGMYQVTSHTLNHGECTTEGSDVWWGSDYFELLATQAVSCEVLAFSLCSSLDTCDENWSLEWSVCIDDFMAWVIIATTSDSSCELQKWETVLIPIESDGGVRLEQVYETAMETGDFTNPYDCFDFAESPDSYEGEWSCSSLEVYEGELLNQE